MNIYIYVYMYIYIIYMCIYVCVCVLDTCELISNDSVDYGLADYGLHGFENVSRKNIYYRGLAAVAADLL